MQNLHKNDLSDLEIIRLSTPAKIRKLIRNGDIDPTVQNDKGQDLLMQVVLTDISPIQVRALISGAESAQKTLNIQTVLQMMDSKCAKALNICENNLTRPSIAKETKKVLSQLFYLSTLSETQRPLLHLRTALVRSETLDEKHDPKKIAQKKRRCVVENPAWSLG